MAEPYERDMIINLIPTVNGTFPNVPAQHWSESEDDWEETGTENPMKVKLKQYEEYKILLTENKDNVQGNLQSLKEAVHNLQILINNSNSKEGD